MRIAKLPLVFVLCIGMTAQLRADETLESTVIKLENALAQACVAGDVKAYEAALSERFRGVNSDGSIESKKAYIDDLRQGTFKCSEYKLRDSACEVLGDVAIFHATVSQKATWNGNDCSGDYQLTDVWSKEKGEWQCIHSQWTTVTKP